MSDNVVRLSVMTTLPINVREVVEGVPVDDMADVLVLGFLNDGELYAASSNSDVGTLLRAIELFKHKLMSGDYS